MWTKVHRRVDHTWAPVGRGQSLWRDWRGEGRHSSLRPGAVQDDEEPDECQQSELVGKMMRQHDIAPSKTWCDGGILSGLGANGISRRVEAHDRRSRRWCVPPPSVAARV